MTTLDCLALGSWILDNEERSVASTAAGLGIKSTSPSGGRHIVDGNQKYDFRVRTTAIHPQPPHRTTLVAQTGRVVAASFYLYLHPWHMTTGRRVPTTALIAASQHPSLARHSSSFRKGVTPVTAFRTRTPTLEHWGSTAYIILQA